MISNCSFALAIPEYSLNYPSAGYFFLQILYIFDFFAIAGEEMPLYTTTTIMAPALNSSTFGSPAPALGAGFMEPVGGGAHVLETGQMVESLEGPHNGVHGPVGSGPVDEGGHFPSPHPPDHQPSSPNAAKVSSVLALLFGCRTFHFYSY